MVTQTLFETISVRTIAVPAAIAVIASQRFGSADIPETATDRLGQGDGNDTCNALPRYSHGLKSTQRPHVAAIFSPP
jgi:hypothetical protein